MEQVWIEFFVPGIPRPGGSKKGFYNKKSGRVMIVDACKESGAWKQQVSFYAQKAYKGKLLTQELKVFVEFHLPRPKGHYGSGKNSAQLKKSAPRCHTIKPDLTKLWRSTEDALTGIIWKDDAQIVSHRMTKEYGVKPGCYIIVQLFD